MVQADMTCENGKNMMKRVGTKNKSIKTQFQSTLYLPWPEKKTNVIIQKQKPSMESKLNLERKLLCDLRKLKAPKHRMTVGCFQTNAVGMYIGDYITYHTFHKRTNRNTSLNTIFIPHSGFPNISRSADIDKYHEQTTK